jgi:hypothetical protein
LIGEISLFHSLTADGRGTPVNGDNASTSKTQGPHPEAYPVEVALCCTRNHRFNAHQALTAKQLPRVIVIGPHRTQNRG